MLSNLWGCAQTSETAQRIIRFFLYLSGEKIWRMPVEDSYWDIMKSPIADMKVRGRQIVYSHLPIDAVDGPRKTCST